MFTSEFDQNRHLKHEHAFDDVDVEKYCSEFKPYHYCRMLFYPLIIFVLRNAIIFQAQYSALAVPTITSIYLNLSDLSTICKAEWENNIKHNGGKAPLIQVKEVLC